MTNIVRRMALRLRRLHKTTVAYPLRTIPELSDRVTIAEKLRQGAQAIGNRVVAENLLFAVQYVTHSSVAGEIAEFGCMTGRTARVIAAAMQLVDSDKELHLFDSFAGLPASTAAPDLENVHVQSGDWDQGTCKGISPVELRASCNRFLPDPAIRIHEGWFSATLPSLPPETSFAMLHIDCDLYQSSFDVLDYVFGTGRVSEGAIILFDDWNCSRASNDHGERRAWREVVEKYGVSSSDLGGYGWAAHKFIVHDYARSSAA